MLAVVFLIKHKLSFSSPRDWPSVIHLLESLFLTETAFESALVSKLRPFQASGYNHALKALIVLVGWELLFAI